MDFQCIIDLENMTDIHLRKIKAGKVTYMYDQRYVVDIIFNDEVLKRIQNSGDLKGNELLLSLRWRDGDDVRNVFSSITFLQNDRMSNATHFSKIVTKEVTTNNGISQLAADLFQAFHARLIMLTLVPVSFVLCHRSIDDFRHLIEDKIQLKEIFRQLTSKLGNFGKAEMKVKLLRGTPGNLPSQGTLTEDQVLRKRGHELDPFGPIDASIEQRFKTIQTEVLKQREQMSLQFENRKQHNVEIQETLSKLMQTLQSPLMEEPCYSKLTMQKKKLSQREGSKESQNDSSEMVSTCHHIYQGSDSTTMKASQIHRANGQPEDNRSMKPNTESGINVNTSQAQTKIGDRSEDTMQGRRISHIRNSNVQSKERHGMSSPHLTDSDNSVFKRPTVPFTRKERMSADDETSESPLYNTSSQSGGANTSNETRKVSVLPAKTKFTPQNTCSADAKKRRTFQSSCYLYPKISIKNKDCKNDESQFGLCRLDYICTLDVVCTQDGEHMIRRKTDYTLTNGEREEKWSKMDEYGHRDNAPSLLDCLPYDLVPVQKQAEFAPQRPTEVTYRNPSDIEKLLIRLDIGISKERHNKLENRHAAICTLDSLREILGEHEPVLKLADNALGEEVVAVHTCATAVDTILCLDNCGTMSREAYLKLKEIAKTFISGIETVADVYGLEENIAIVTLGSGAKVDHHLSIDYDGLKNVVDQIECGGTSSKSYLEGIMVCLAAVTKGGVTNFGHYLRVPARLIFVTDGITVGKAGQCKSTNERRKVLRALHELGSDFVRKSVFSPIVVVPHGAEDKSFVKSMVEACKGTFVDDISSLCDHQRIHMQSAQIIRYVESQCGFKRTSAMKLDGIINTLTKGFRSASKEKIRDIVEKRLNQNQNKTLDCTTDFDNINEEEGLPPLGTRVIRGPDWKWANEDSECAGTVINHDYDKEHLYVMWDSGMIYPYRYGLNGNYDVLSVDDHPVLPQEEIFIKIGMQVERGPDWHEIYCDQDGGPGGYGTVIRYRNGRVMVRWKDGAIHPYRFGENGRYDLTIRNPITLPPPTQKEAKVNTFSSMSEMEFGKKTLQPSRQSKSVELWQWLDKDGTWITYSEDVNIKLTKTFSKRPDGSCLVEKGGKSFRVSFKTLTEKSIDDKKATPVRKCLVW